jgi:peptidoglycan/LPS O-acetylase OafA/YrhL
VSVVVGHALFAIDPSLPARVFFPTIQSLSSCHDIAAKLILFAFPGDVAVAIFFVLSGAVLFNSLIRSDQSALVATPKFIWRRVLRIYPALIVSILVYACALGFESSAVFINAVLWDFPVNGPTWTLNVEFLAVPFLLLAYAGYRVFRESGMLVVFCVFWALSGLQFLKPHPELARLTMFCFAIGAIIPTRWGRWIATRMSPWIIPVVFIAMFLARHLVEGKKTGTNIQFISAGILVAMLYYHRVGSLGRFLSGSTSQFLGRISYSFYLYHALFVELLCPKLREYAFAAENPLASGLATSAIVVLMTIPVAHLSTIYIERPALKFAKTKSAEDLFGD